MKWLLFLWAGPVALLFGWYFLSLNDLSFGIFMLTREAHDLVFRIYGNILGIDPALLPPMCCAPLRWTRCSFWRWWRSAVAGRSRHGGVHAAPGRLTSRS